MPREAPTVTGRRHTLGPTTMEQAHIDDAAIGGTVAHSVDGKVAFDCRCQLAGARSFNATRCMAPSLMHHEADTLAL